MPWYRLHAIRGILFISKNMGFEKVPKAAGVQWPFAPDRFGVESQ